MPNGIILFNYMDDSIGFENQMVEEILKKKSPKCQSNNDLISINEIAEEKDDENMYDTIIIKEITFMQTIKDKINKLKLKMQN